jgi:serine/threonine protein kinase
MIEKEMLMMLKHPGILKFHSSFTDKEKLYFVMELAEGGDFSQYMKLYSKLGY